MSFEGDLLTVPGVEPPPFGVAAGVSASPAAAPAQGVGGSGGSASAAAKDAETSRALDLGDVVVDRPVQESSGERSSDGGSSSEIAWAST
mmetsp:Transcript_77742/g.204762  ORF Transcript_77742/g.204762 Transcript_77742/m.204762 type:complete len:90 (-) Transcript_77742:268-537(-)